MVTRNNYEEFFLLYVDNELSAAEREAVERFLRDNPDLEIELDQLKQSVLRPGDETIFGNKESLFRNRMTTEKKSEETLLRGELPVWGGESSFIDEENYPTYLLSYIDEELDEESRKTVEAHVRQHPRLEEELAILRQTRLEADPAIEFVGKELLYKHEYDKRGLLLSWSRIAAAILLLMAGLLVFDKTTHRQSNPSSTKEFLAGEKKRQNPVSPVTLAATDSLHKNGADDTVSEKGISGAEASNEKLAKKRDGRRRQPTDPGNRLQHDRTTTVPDEKQPVAVIPRKDPEKADQNGEGSPDKKMVSPGNNNQRGVNEPVANNPSPEGTIAPTAVQITSPSPVNGLAALAIANKDNTIAMVREGIPIEDPSAIKKNKMRGLFRKVTRVLERTTNADNDNNDNTKHGVLIGNFQVAL